MFGIRLGLVSIPQHLASHARDSQTVPTFERYQYAGLSRVSIPAYLANIAFFKILRCSLQIRSLERYATQQGGPLHINIYTLVPSCLV